MTSDGTYNYTYDIENRLTQVNRTSDNSLVSTYSYYFNGLRKTKTVNGITTTYNWDNSSHLVKETTSDGNTWLYYYDSNGNLVGGKKNNQTYLYHTNLRGDVVSITDYAGNILAQYNYDPWGNQISYTGTLVQPLRYAGYYVDEEVNLYYLQSRYYSPGLGRFLTRDSYGYIDYKNPQTLNLYGYCGNDPVNNSDPTGHMFEWAQKGRDFAEQVYRDFPDYIKNTKTYITSFGNRIPDIINEKAKIVGEIKNVSYQALTRQIRGFLEIAKDEGSTFVLVIRKGATLSGPLLKAIIDAGGVIVEATEGAVDMVPMIVPTNVLEKALSPGMGAYDT